MSLSLVMDAIMAVSYRCHCVSVFSVDFLSTSIQISTIKRQHDVHSLCYALTFTVLRCFVSGHSKKEETCPTTNLQGLNSRLKSWSKSRFKGALVENITE